MLSLIANVDANDVISVNGRLAYPSREDFKHFKRSTMGHTVLVGKNTYEECKHLGGRDWVLLTRENSQELLEYASKSSEICFLGGGAPVFEAGLSYCQTLILSRVVYTKEFPSSSKLTYLSSKYKTLFSLHSQLRSRGFTIELWS